MKAPGKAVRRGPSLPELIRMFPDDKATEERFAKQRWPEGKPACPHCGSDNVQSGAKHKTMPYRCREKKCAKRFSVKTGTVMENSNLGCQTWAIALHLLLTSLKGVSSMKLHRDLGITQKSAWHLAHRIREAWNLWDDRYEGPVEADEAYFDGLEKNKHRKNRLGVGGGTKGKTTVVGVKDRKTNRITAQVIDSGDARLLAGFVASRAVPSADHSTDDAMVYRGLPNHYFVHHSIGEYVDGPVHINGMESFWAMLKRGYLGTYQRISPKHLGRYVNEFPGATTSGQRTRSTR